MENVVEAVEVVEEKIDRPYTLRKLKDKDIFPLLQLLRKIGVKDFKGAFNSAVEGELSKVGIDVMLNMADILIENICSGAGEDIYSFWSELSGITVEDIKEMEFGTLPLMIYDSFSEVKNTSFFKVLSKLL